MRRSKTVAGVLAVGVLAAGVSAAPVGAQTREGARSVLRQAVDGVGGRRALARLSSFQLRAGGRTFVFDEGLRPGNSVTDASTFTIALDYDLRRGGDRLRADYVRTSLGTDRRVSEVVSGRLGYIAGVDSNGGPAATKPMTSDRWAAVTREQRLLNPHLILRAALARPSLVATAPSRTLDGRPHRILVVRDAVASIRLYVDRRSGRVDRLTTLDHNYNRGDLPLVVDYRDWRGAGGGVRFPRTVTLKEAGQILHTERRSSVRANRRIAGSRFAIPGSVGATFDAALAARGARTTEWLMTFAHLGFIKDGPATQIVPRVFAPGSTLIQGIPNNSMLVEQQDGIVVVEGALNDRRAEALIRYIRANFPGKPIRFVTGSHHHADHSGGMRPFVALGARAVVHEDAVPFFRRVFAVRDSRLVRDRLDGSTVDANILGVPAARSVTLPDPVRPVVVLPERTDHATTTILVFVPSEGVLFVNGDTYTPTAPPGPGARSLDQTIRSNGLAVRWIVGGHGGVVSYADSQRALAQAPR
jgi:glyoxylase-like metal-dependent hydrolase (beta-lactamase superfamily II)